MIITLYDPPMCCASGVCGPAADPGLVALQATLRRIEKAGVRVQRFGLSRVPGAFVESAAVSALLRAEGNEVLPLTFVDGELLTKGRYPEVAEFEQALRQRGIELPAVEAEEGPRCC